MASPLNFLDVRTVIFSQLLTDLIGVLVLAGLRRQNRTRFAGMAYWVADFGCQAAGTLLISLRGSIPDWISMVVANTFVIGGALLGYIGLERFVDRKSSQIHNYVMLAAFVTIMSYFAFAQPNLAVRNIAISAALLVICFQCMWLMWRRVPTGMRQMTYSVGLVFAIFVLVSLVRMLVTLVTPHSSNDFFKSGVFDVLSLIAYQLLLILLAYTLALMVNRRLLADVQAQEEKFSKAFRLSPYAITLTRPSDGRIFEVNAGFAEITGYQPAEVIGKSTLDLNLWAREEDRTSVVDALTRGRPVRGREYEFRKRTGEKLTGLFSAEVITVNGEPAILSSIADITERRSAEVERERLLSDLQEAMATVKKLSGIVPICASCKKIRDEEGYWHRIEEYIRDHSEADFTHGLCPECARALYPELYLDAGKTPDLGGIAKGLGGVLGKK